MNSQQVRRLLDRIGVLRNRCDLDLLVFFARHPRSMLTSEWLGIHLGHPHAHIADSLEVLLKARLLSRALSQAHAARMYYFAADGPDHEYLPHLLRLASTREGRLALIEALKARPRKRRRPGRTREGKIKNDLHGRPVVVRLKPRTSPRIKAG